MKDTQRLFRGITAALGISSALCLSSCTGKPDNGSTGTKVVTKTDDGGTKREPEAKADGGESKTPPETGEPPIERLPSCPEGDWCGTKATATAMAKAYVEAGNDKSEVEMGCPKRFGGNPELAANKGYEGLPAEAYTDLDTQATERARDKGEKDACCYQWHIPCPGGRPYLVEGEARVAMTRAGAAWSAEVGATPIADLRPALRERIGQEWLADALMEHASIASFSRFALQLLAVAAPPELIADAHRAALDEVEHARGCFAVAARYGLHREPGPLFTAEIPATSLLDLVEGTFVEGCVGETIAALAATRAGAGATDSETRALLDRIQRDEARHAALAWRTIRWAVGVGGDAIRDRLRVLVSSVRPSSLEVQPEPDAPLLAAHGRLDAAGGQRAADDAWRDIIDPALDAMLGDAQPNRASA